MSGQNKKNQSFRLSVSDGDSHENIWSVKFTGVKFAVAALSAFFLLVAVFFSVIAFTPVRVLIPGYPDADTKRAAIQNAIRIDSLENAISRWELYTVNLVSVLEGGEPVSLDSIIALNTVKRERKDEAYLASRDSALKAQVVAAEQFDVSGKQRALPIEGLHFFTPLNGKLLRGYDAIRHPYVEIEAQQNSVVKAALDGTVIFSGFNDESRYTLVIQHDDDMLTVYRNNVRLLKKNGDRITAGTSIALAGDGAGLKDGDMGAGADRDTSGTSALAGISPSSCLRFELWHKGEALNAADYINF